MNLTAVDHTIGIDLEKADLEMVFTIVYTLVDDLYPQVVPEGVAHRRGPQPELSDSEVITISLVGEMLCDSETAWVHFVARNYAALFPHLNERSRFHRRSKDLWQVKNLLRRHVLEQMGALEERYHIIDSVPIPICKYVRAARCQLFLGEVDKERLYGVCASKKEKVYGFRLHLLVSIEGIPVDCVLAPAAPHDVTLAPEVLEGHERIVVGGDKGYVGQELAEHLWLESALQLISRKRRNQHQQNTPSETWFLNRFRKMIETVNSILTEQFHLAKPRARKLWGLASRVISKLTSFTFALYINKLLGRPLLEVKSIAL